MLIIHDSEGKVYFAGTGFSAPSGTLSYLETEVPDGKYFDGVDTSVNPPQPIFKDIPKSEMQLLKEQIEQLKSDNDILAGSIMEMSEKVYE